MNTYITAPTIKALREQKKLTQAQLADQLSVSHKTISKWETGKGLPDISLLEPLAKALGVSRSYFPDSLRPTPTGPPTCSGQSSMSVLSAGISCMAAELPPFPAAGSCCRPWKQNPRMRRICFVWNT